jgi:hypothetical protein
MTTVLVLPPQLNKTTKPQQRPRDMILLLDHPLEASAAGWVEALDEASGHLYYYNTNTGTLAFTCSHSLVCSFTCDQ